jgi:DNA-binding MurR/RpiR family transcriptional regulator
LTGIEQLAANVPTSQFMSVAANRRLIFTGFGIGGAVATLATLKLLHILGVMGFVSPSHMTLTILLLAPNGKERTNLCA